MKIRKDVILNWAILVQKKFEIGKKQLKKSVHFYLTGQPHFDSA